MGQVDNRGGADEGVPHVHSGGAAERVPPSTYGVAAGSAHRAPGQVGTASRGATTQLSLGSPGVIVYAGPGLAVPRCGQAVLAQGREGRAADARVRVARREEAHPMLLLW